MIASLKTYATEIGIKREICEHKKPATPSMLGHCLKCGTHMTRCGIPFTAEITCQACGAVNIYRDSQQPVDLLLQ